MKTEAQKRANKAYYARHREAVILQVKCRANGVSIPLDQCRKLVRKKA